MIITKNQTEKHEFTITDDLGALNLTGCTVRFYVEDVYGNEVYSQDVTQFDAPLTGIVIVTIPKEDSAQLVAGNAKSQVFVLTPTGEKYYSDVYATKIVNTLN
jgi:hypothetical protein